MTINVEDSGDVKLVRMQGELVSGADSPFAETVTDLLTQAQARVVLDLQGVDYINSAGLGDLVRVVAQANAQEARVILAGLSPYVAGVLETTRLNRFFEIAPTVEDALKKLA